MNKLLKKFFHINFFFNSSNTEDLLFVCLEALSSGIPIIRDTFLTAPFLVDNGNNGILLNKNLSGKEITDIIKKTNVKNFNKNKILNFVKNNFDISNFVKVWNEILKDS